MRYTVRPSVLGIVSLHATMPGNDLFNELYNGNQLWKHEYNISLADLFMLLTSEGCSAYRTQLPGWY